MDALIMTRLCGNGLGVRALNTKVTISAGFAYRLSSRGNPGPHILGLLLLQGKNIKKLTLLILCFCYLKKTQFLYASCIEKVLRLKLYLPRQKWTMNETLIFSELRAAFKKKYQDWRCIYQDRNEQWMKRSHRNMRCIEKVLKLMLYLPRQKWIMNETLILSEFQAVLKKYQDWSCIYQDRNEQWMKR